MTDLTDYRYLGVFFHPISRLVAPHGKQLIP